MECHGDSSGSLSFPFLSAFPFQYVSGQPEVDGGVAFGHPPRPSASGRAVESRTRADGGPGSGHCSQADWWLWPLKNGEHDGLMDQLNGRERVAGWPIFF